MHDDNDKQNSGQIMKRTVFLDRDGVINRDSPLYIKSCEEFDFLPGSLEALRLLTLHQYDIIVITNQSIIGRGMVPPAELGRIFDKMTREVASAGGTIRDIFFCPHHPEDGCDCRKPKPAMILSAHEKHHIDLEQAVMIGDSAKDIQCARNAGVGTAVLVLTGNGPEALNRLKNGPDAPDHVAEDLLAAAAWLIDRDSGERHP